MIPPITFSNQILNFQKGSQQAYLTITNNNPNIILYFKVKTTKLDTYQVKPAKGLIHPDKDKTISFKIIKPLLNVGQIESLEAKDKFMIEFLKVSTENPPQNKKQLSEFWAKQKSIDSKSIENFTLSLRIQHDFQRIQPSKILQQLKEPASPLRSHQSTFYKMKSFDKKTQTVEEYNKNLAEKFQKLKEEEEELLKKREQVFVGEKKVEGKKQKLSIGSILLLIVMFLIGVIIGNFIKLRVLV